MASNQYNSDAVHIETMLTSAKMGNWDVVFDILENKSYLVNCVSTDRAWGVLHQAAWMNLFPVVKSLVKIPGCDPAIKTKQDKACKFGPGKTPRDLCTNHGIKCYLLEAERKALSFSPTLSYPTFVTVESEFELTGRSISLALSCFNKILCKDLDLNYNYTFSFLMSTIFRECVSNWIAVKSQIGLALKLDYLPMSNFLLNGDFGKKSKFKTNPDTMEQFFDRVIKLFTNERTTIDFTLAMQANPNHTPKSSDIVSTAYAVLLNSILMNWNSLNKCKRWTYRCMNLCPFDLSQYNVGQEFTWLNFSSSSIDKQTAMTFSTGDDVPVIFKIDNRPGNKWSPRYIESHSFFPQENECLYPSGARFWVTKRKEKNIELKLSNYAM